MCATFNNETALYTNLKNNKNIGNRFLKLKFVIITTTFIQRIKT